MMTEHNQKVFDKLIKDLEEQRLKLYRSAAQLDETIQNLMTDRHLDNRDEAMDSCISVRANYRAAYLHNSGIGRDEETEEIFKAAIGNFKV